MKIGDFGLAIELDSPRLFSKSLCGTTNYLAPEVVDRKGFALGSDIWACGVMAFVLLYGYTPFEEHDVMETYKRISRVDYLYVLIYSILICKSFNFIYGLHFDHTYSLPSDLDDDAKHFFKSVLEKDLSRRPNAEQCLQLPFLMKYIIPPALSDDIFTQTHVLDQLALKEQSSHLHGMFESAPFHF